MLIYQQLINHFNSQYPNLMKVLSVFLMLMIVSAAYTQAQQSEEKAIKQVITDFMKAGDQQDVAALEAVLDTHYRVVMNRLFGSSEVAVLPREVYLQKIAAKEFGGDKRKLDFQEFLINGITASVKVKSTGEKMSMVSLLTLVQDDKGSWKIVEDAPVIIQ